MDNLNDLLVEAAVFVDYFSASQFRKLFELKKILSLIEGSINKSVKEQLDKLHAGIK